MIKDFDKMEQELYRSGWIALVKLIGFLIIIGLGIWELFL